MNLDDPAPLHHLPFVRNLDEAQATARKQNDPFYLTAFLIQCWLGGLLQDAAAQYAEKKNPKDRLLQTGQAWRTFLETFPAPGDFCHHLSCLFRFSANDISPRNSLRRALVPLSVEHRHTGAYLGPKDLHPGQPTGQQDQLARRTIIRWCDWLDAAVHMRTHRRWHTAPACFDPDPEKRELAALGNAQRHFARLDEQAKNCWRASLEAAALKYKNSRKWAVLGQAFSDSSDRLWPYAAVDTLVIALWPVVNLYNWTYRDLLNAIRPALKQAFTSPGPHAAPSAPNWSYPCEREQDLAAYCVNVLGLRKTVKGLTAKSGHPAGYDIAKIICPALAPQPNRAPKP